MLIQVKFRHGEDHHIHGTITHDEARRAKIVFIYGYRPERYWQCRWPLPKDGEEWICEVQRDTAPADPYKGALLVRLRRPVQLSVYWQVELNYYAVEVMRHSQWGLKTRSQELWEVTEESQICPDWPDHVRREVSMLLQYRQLTRRGESPCHDPKPCSTTVE